MLATLLRAIPAAPTPLQPTVCSTPPRMVTDPLHPTGQGKYCAAGKFGCIQTDPALPALIWVMGGCGGTFECQGIGNTPQTVRCLPHKLPWRKVYCACTPPPPALRRQCFFSRTPKTGGGTVQEYFSGGLRPPPPIDAIGSKCHASPRPYDANGASVERTCAGVTIPPYNPAVADGESAPPCVVTLLRDPVLRFESAWRFGFANVLNSGKELDGLKVWKVLGAAFPGGANQFVAAARSSNKTVAQGFEAAGVTLIDPSIGDGVCCHAPEKVESALFSPQHLWVRPSSLSGLTQIVYHVLCTETLVEDVSRVLTALGHPAAHQPIALPHVHQTKKTKVLEAVSSLSEENKRWLREQYAEDDRLHKALCGGGKGRV